MGHDQEGVHDGQRPGVGPLRLLPHPIVETEERASGKVGFFASVSGSLHWVWDFGCVAGYLKHRLFVHVAEDIWKGFEIQKELIYLIFDLFATFS